MLATQKVPLRALCVFCGASPGNNPKHIAAAKALGDEIVKRNMTLVYGGGSVGLMGAIASTVATAGGPQSVIGVIPESLTQREVSGEMLGQLHVVPDMHSRKALMARHADGFVAMPGGFGTLEELLEVITWQSLGFHAKPIGLLNTDNFYGPLLAFFQQCVSEGFIRPQHNCLIVAEDPSELIDRMAAFEPPESLIASLVSAATAEQAVGADVALPST